MLAAVAGVSELAFRTVTPLAYLVFPALGWAALRFSRRGATLAVAVAVGFAVWNTTRYHGPFVFDSITLSVLTTQLYIAVAALSTLSLAALVCERKQFAARLDASRARLIKATDTERQRLERNLHDGTQQRLTALAMRLEMDAESAGSAHEPGPRALKRAQAEVILAIDELRELARGIHPQVLTDAGLAAAIRQLAARSTVPITLGQLPSTRLDDIAETTAYYLVAEALTNAQKHAHATCLQVHATITRGTLRLDIVDDGVGGATELANGGLTGLRDRVEAHGGTFTLNSPDGRGTRITATIPATPAAP
jgi:signal transduction histidine kinase